MQNSSVAIVMEDPIISKDGSDLSNIEQRGSGISRQCERFQFSKILIAKLNLPSQNFKEVLVCASKVWKCLGL